MKGRVRLSISAVFLVMTSFLATADDFKVVASDNAIMQQEDPAMPTRLLKDGTKINMHFGNTVIP